MPVDFRWHAFTVIAIFLAVGIGVLIGAALPPDNVVLEKQQAVLTRLEAELVRLRDDKRQLAQLTSELNATAGRQSETIETLAKMAVAERLFGKHILLAEWGPVSLPTRDALIASLEQSGASVAVGSIELGQRGDQRLETVTAFAGAIRIRNNVQAGLDPDALVVVNDGHFLPAAGATTNAETWLRALPQMIPVVLAQTSRIPSSAGLRLSEFGMPVVAAVDQVLGRVELIFALTEQLAVDSFPGGSSEAAEP